MSRIINFLKSEGYGVIMPSIMYIYFDMKGCYYGSKK